MQKRCSAVGGFFWFLNASDPNGKSYVDRIINLNGELSDEFLTVFDNYLTLQKKKLGYRTEFKQKIKTIVHAYVNENQDYRASSLYTPLIDQILNNAVPNYKQEPNPSAGTIISMIATHEQQKSFESEWFLAFVFHFPVLMSKVREEAKKIENVQILLQEFEQKQNNEDKAYTKFVNGNNMHNLPNEYVQKTFKFLESLLKNGSEFLVDCVYHSLHSKLFDDHHIWKDMSLAAPLKRNKPNDMSDKKWLEFKRNALQLFKRKERSKYEGEFTARLSYGGRDGLQVAFTNTFPFCLINLVKPTITEYMFLRFLLGWHQFTEIKHQNSLTLKELTPFDDGVIRVIEAYKSRTGDVEGLRELVMNEFPRTAGEYKVFEIYRVMLTESYEKYPSVFASKTIAEKLLFSLDSIKTKYVTSENFSCLFKYVGASFKGEVGFKAKLFYGLFEKWMEIKHAKNESSNRLEGLKQKTLERIKLHMTDRWNSITADDFEKLEINALTPNSFRLSAQGHVHAYVVNAGKTGFKQQLKHSSANEVLGAMHAHSGQMDHQYMIRNRNPALAESENVFGEQVATEMIEQAQIAWTQVLSPLEGELLKQLEKTEVWTLEELREHLGISIMEEMRQHRNESEEARAYLLKLLEQDEMSAYEGYGHQVLGATNKLNHHQIIIDSALTCFLMMHQVNYLDEQIKAFINKKISPIKKSLDSITVKALVTRAYFSAVIDTKFSETTRKGARALLKEYSSFPPIQL